MKKDVRKKLEIVDGELLKMMERVGKVLYEISDVDIEEFFEERGYTDTVADAVIILRDDFPWRPRRRSITEELLGQ